MQINVSKDENGQVFGQTQGDQQALIILTGKNSLTPEELEEAVICFTGSNVTFNQEKKP